MSKTSGSTDAHHNGEGGPCVLVVDDSVINLEACSSLLSLWGIEPVLASDGAQALELVRQRRFDLVLMDIRMPVLDGLAATEQIRRFEQQQPGRPSVPVVAYSSDDVPPDIARKVGLSGVLRKPSDTASLGECLRTWCADKLPKACGPTA